MSSFGFDKTPPAGSVAVSEWKSQRGYLDLHTAKGKLDKSMIYSI